MSLRLLNIVKKKLTEITDFWHYSTASGGHKILCRICKVDQVAHLTANHVGT